MNDDMQHFRRFMKQREEAARAYVNGDPGPVAQLSARVSPATFFHPAGPCVRGADRVLARYERDAAHFDAGGESRFEIFQMAAGGGIAYWVGLQHATARLKGKPEPVQMSLRVTEIFRREGGEWKLIHRHADMPPSGSK